MLVDNALSQSALSWAVQYCSIPELIPSSASTSNALDLNLFVPALYLEIRAIDKGTDNVSSQRFSYFGSLAIGEEGEDGAVFVEFPFKCKPLSKRGEEAPLL